MLYFTELLFFFILQTKTVCLVLGTEFVVVEDSSCQDTNAIILKGTAVLTYKPRLKDRPFSGSLAGVEVMNDPHASIVLKKPMLSFQFIEY